MATYSITGPDGTQYTIDGPEGATQDQVVRAIQRQQALQEAQQKAHEAKTGFIPAVKAGTRQFLGGAEEALGFEKAAEEQRQKAAAVFEPTTEEDIARAKEKGIFPTAGAYLSQKITEPLGGMIGRYGAPTIAGAVAPEAAIAGLGARALAFGAADLPASIGESMEAQKAAGQEVDPLKAIAAGLAKTTIATVGMPGVGRLSEALGPKVLAEAEVLAPQVAAGTLTKEAALAQLSGRAKTYAQSMLANTVAGTGMMLGTEAVERLQTGQPQMTGEEVLKTVETAALLSPIFALMHPTRRAEAEKAIKEAGITNQQQIDFIASRIHSTPDKPVQDIINEAVGVKPEVSEKELKQFREEKQADIEAALNEPSGQFGIDPVTGNEKEFTVGELQKIQRPELFPEEPANIVSKETLTDLGIKESTPIVKKGGLEGLDLNKPEEAQQFIEGLSLFKEQPKLDPTVKLRIEAKLKEVQDKLKGLEDERLRTERDRENIQVSGEPLGGRAEGIGEPVGAGDIQPTASLRPVEGGEKVRGAPLEPKAPEATEVIKGEVKPALAEVTPGVEKEKLVTALKDRFGSNVNKAMQRGDVNVISMDELAKTNPELHATIPADAQAFFHKGKAYLLHDRMTEQEAPRKLLHEVGAHFGLEGMVGKDPYRNILRELNRLRATDKNVADAFTHVTNKYKDLAEGSHGHLEEVLARLGESAPNHTVWRKIVAAVKNFLIKKGLFNPNKMDVRDIHDLINRSTERSLAGKIKAEEAKPEIQYAKAELPISERFNETKVFSPPDENQERTFKEFATGSYDQFKTEEGRKEIKDATSRAFIDGRIKVAYAGAGVQSKLIKDFNGAVLDATNNVRADILYDQALNGNILGSVSAKEGKVVFDQNGVAKVEPSPYHINAIFDELGKLGKRIGNNDAKHVASAYLQALRYKDILENNARLKDLIARTENAKLKEQYQKDIKTVTAGQEAGIAPALKYGNEFPEVKKMAEIYDRVNRDEIDLLEKAGIYSKEYADKLRKTKGYVPLYRVMDDLDYAAPGARQHFRGLADIGKQHAFEGSERQSLDVLDNMLTRHMWAVNAAVRNNANRMLSKQLAIHGEDGQPVYHYKPTAENADRMAPIWENGSRKYVEYSDPHFAQAVYGLEPSLGPILGFMGKASKALRIGVTATPTFQVYQLFNDAPRVAMLSGVNRPFKLMGEVFKSFYTALKDPNDPILQEMHRLGISGGYGHNAKEIADKMRRDLGLETNTLMKRALDKTESFAAASDMAQRRAVFKRTLLETGGVENVDGSITGGNKVLAMDRAMNIIHWQKHGTSNKVRVLTQVVPFLNAYIQGMDTLVRAMRGEGISGMEKKQAQLLFAQTALKIAALSTIYAMAVSGDEEYQKLDDRQKIRSFIIPGTGIKIPVAAEVAMFTKAIPEMTWQYINREGTANPMDSTKLMNAIGTSFADGLLGPNLMPQAFRAGIEVATNHDFLTGHPIVGRGLENLETSQQFTENTSELAKIIGKTGVISPLNLDHLLRGYGGTMASSVLFASDAGLNMFYNDKLPTTPIYRIPMISSFMYSPEGKGQLNDYYDLKNRSDEVAATLNHIAKFGTPEELQEYRLANKDMLGIRGQINAISNNIKNLREQRKRIIAGNLSADEKRSGIDQIDARINNMVQNIGALRVKAGL